MKKAVFAIVALGCIVFSMVLGLIYFSDRKPLRGVLERSEDGKTYLIVADRNDGQCEQLLVDGEPWPHKVDERVEIAADFHKIECGSAIDFEIPVGFVFKFHDWSQRE